MDTPPRFTVSGHVRSIGAIGGVDGDVRASLWDVARVSIVEVDLLSVSCCAREEKGLDSRDPMDSPRALNMEIDSRRLSERKNCLTLPMGKLDIRDLIITLVEE